MSNNAAVKDVVIIVCVLVLFFALGGNTRCQYAMLLDVCVVVKRFNCSEWVLLRCVLYVAWRGLL